MKNLTKKQKQRIRKIMKILFIGLVTLLIYQVGFFAGFIQGFSFGLEKGDLTLCEGLNKERDVDGFCLLSNKTYKYSGYLICDYEKFKILGEKNPGFLIKVITDIKGWAYYPVIRC